MKEKIHLFIEQIFGRNLTFEHKIFLFLASAGTLVSSIAFVANISLGINAITYLVPFLNVVVDTACVLYFIKTKKWQTPLLIVICVATFFLFPFLWFSTGGAVGSTIPFIVMSGVMFVVALPQKEKRILVIITPILYGAFILLEMQYPNIVMAYPNRTAHYIDLVFGFVLSFFITVGLASAVLNSYKNAAKQLETLAYYNAFTGAPNFEYFRKMVTQCLVEKPEEKFVCIQFDIRNFKIINEMFGRDAGDTVLKAIAEKLTLVQESKEYHDVIYSHIGADKFILFRQLNHGRKCNRLSEFFDLIKEEMVYLNDYRPEFNVGRYFVTQGDTADILVERVNLAHNFARINKSDTYVDYAPEFTTNLLAEINIGSKMYDALVNKEFAIYLQGKYSLIDESLCGAESLVRWIGSDGKIIPPNDFIPIFERNGFITKLDMYMFTSCCEILDQWKKQGKPLVPISVNFSRKHLTNKKFADDLYRIAKRYNVDPAYLEIELTETAVMDSDFDLPKFVDQLHSFGFQISMDDFGTGYSSLGLLKNLNIDTIKLDRSFFLDAQENANAHSVLSNMLSMTIDLGIKSVAEGVEEKQHVELLQQLNCDVIQGYYFGKPIPAVAFTLKMEDEVNIDTLAAVNDKSKRFNLRKNNELLIHMMDSMPLAFTLWDEDGTVLQCNKEAVSLLGFRDEKEMLDRMYDAIPEYQPSGVHSRTIMAEQIALTFLKGYVRYPNWVFETATEGRIPCEVILIRIINKGQRRVACYMRDMRLQLLGEEKSKRILSGMLDNLSSMIYIVDFDSHEILYENIALQKFMGTSVVGTKCHKLLKGIDQHCEQCLLRNKSAQGMTVPATIFNQALGVHMLAMSSVVEWTDGTMVGLVNLIDNSKYEDLIDAIPLTLGLFDANFEILRCNNAAAQLFGFDSQEAYMKHFPSTIPEYQPDGTRSATILARNNKEAFLSGAHVVNFMQQHRDGTPIPTEVTLSAILFDQKPVLAAFSRDLRPQIEQENLRKAEAILLDANDRMKAMMDATPMCFNLWDEHMVNIMCNQEAVDLFELSSEEEYLNRFFELSPEFQPDGSLSGEKAVRMVETARKMKKHVFFWMHKKINGDQIPAEITLVAIEIQNKAYVAGFTRDLRGEVAEKSR